jgi:ABC-type phosphate transport system substrate-binding protein
VSLIHDAIGVLGFDYFQENLDLINAIPINDTIPSIHMSAKNNYPFFRPLFLYINYNLKARQDVQLMDFMKEIAGDEANGVDGYLSRNYLIPLSEQELELRNQIINQSGF